MYVGMDVCMDVWMYVRADLFSNDAPYTRCFILSYVC